MVAALVEPIAELAADGRRGADYVAFLTAVLRDPEYLPLVVDTYESQTARELAALERVTPHLDPDERMVRFSLAKDLVNTTLGSPRGPVQVWLDRHVPGVDLADRLTDFITAAFAA